MHKWVTNTLGRPRVCLHCNRDDKLRYEWANISGTYKREITDWIRLCRGCHISYDKKNPKHPTKKGYVPGNWWTTVVKKGVGKPPVYEG